MAAYRILVSPLAHDQLDAIQGFLGYRVDAFPGVAKDGI